MQQISRKQGSGIITNDLVVGNIADGYGSVEGT